MALKLVKNNKDSDIVKNKMEEWGAMLKCLHCGKKAPISFKEIADGLSVTVNKCECRK